MVRSIRIAAMAKATSNSPCTLAYIYKATVSVEPALFRPSKKPFSACAKPAVNNSAADSPRMRPMDRMQPVITPSTQPGSTTVRITRHLPAPRPNAPSR